MNLEQLQAMTDEQLDEAVALSQWGRIRRSEPNEFNNYTVDYFYKTEDKKIISVNGYHPTADTDEGKAQSFNLMVKYGVEPEFSKEGRCWIETAHDKKLDKWKDRFDGVNLAGNKEQTGRLIVIASILSAQEQS